MTLRNTEALKCRVQSQFCPNGASTVLEAHFVPKDGRRSTRPMRKTRDPPIQPLGFFELQAGHDGLPSNF